MSQGHRVWPQVLKCSNLGEFLADPRTGRSTTGLTHVLHIWQLWDAPALPQTGKSPQNQQEGAVSRAWAGFCFQIKHLGDA